MSLSNYLWLMSDYVYNMYSVNPLQLEDEEIVYGKIAIVTGANSGLGKETVRKLSKRGATVIMACRNIYKGEIAKQDIIKAELLTGELIVMELNLADLYSVRRFVGEVTKKFDMINILVNNAGITKLSGITERTNDGFEAHMGVMHLGHFLLTRLLLNHLKAGAPSRIICVASTMHLTAQLNPHDLLGTKSESHGIANFLPYNNAKLAIMYFVQELARQTVGTGVNVYAVCPGLCSTNLWRDLNWFQKLNLNSFLMVGGFSADQGSETIMHAAISKRLANSSGEMLRFGRVWEDAMNFLSGDTEIAKSVWEESERLVHLQD